MHAFAFPKAPSIRVTYIFVYMYMYIYIYVYIELYVYYKPASGSKVLYLAFGLLTAPGICLRSIHSEPWEDQKTGSTLGLHNLHHRSIKVQILGFHFLDPFFGSCPGSGNRQLHRGVLSCHGCLPGGAQFIHRLQSPSLIAVWCLPLLHPVRASVFEGPEVRS